MASFLNNIRQMVMGPDQLVEAANQQPGHGGSTGTPYHPTPIDICLARAILNKSKGLPPDIIDIIFDHAEYWARSSNTINFQEEHQSPLRIMGQSPTENRFLLRSFPVGLTGVYGFNSLAEELAYDTNEAKALPLEKEHDASYFKKLANYPTPALVNPVRKVVFSIRSKDQGWGGEPGTKGTYNSSWSWFEAGLERFDETQTCDAQCNYDVRYQSPKSTASALPVCALRPIRPTIESSRADDKNYKYVHDLAPDPNWTIQRNVVATRNWKDHVVTWSYLDHTDPDSDAGMELDNKGRGRGTGDGSFVRDLKMGDVVTVWGKARFGGWANHVEKVTIDIYWAV